VAEVKLTAELRTEFGKGAARRIRRAAKIPAVLYGHGSDPIHITLPGHETLLALREQNALLSIYVDGKAQLALPKQIQRDPLKGFIEHVDLVMVRRGEKVTVDIALHTEGESAVDTVVVLDRNDISVEAEATHIPEGITVSVEGLEAGAQIYAKDLPLPEGTTLAIDEETLIVSVSDSRIEEESAADEAEGTEGETAEGESAEEPEESEDSES
jgi:large subunit ribosomal protein L25